MPFETERLTHVNPPTPDQLRELANIGIRSAVARKRFKPIRRLENTHYFVDEVDLLSDAASAEENPAQIRHRMALRIGVRPARDGEDKVSSLKFLDTFFVEATPGEWRAERSTYRFEWTRRRVLMADRVMRLVGFGEAYDKSLQDDIEHFRIQDDAAALLQVSEELRMISADDCEELKRDMSDYVSVVETVSR